VCFIPPSSAVCLWMQKRNDYENRSTFVKVIVELKVARFTDHRADDSSIYAV